jgi:DNA polymerase I
MPRRPRTLYLVDGNAQFHRAYFAIRGLTTSRGLPTGATYGFTTMLKKLLADEDPEWIGICFDPPGRTFRHEQYSDYKANRVRMDDDLAVQIPYVRRVCAAFHLPILELPGYEADDVIATLAGRAREQGLRTLVVSADKDLLQLVADDVQVLNPGRDSSGAVLFDRALVLEKWGVPPEQIVDVLALMGDSVDNVPGVPGIGEKGARDLVKQYGTLDNVLEHAAEVKRASYRDGLQQHREAALLSKQLVTLRADVPIALDLESLRRRDPDAPAARALFSELEFVALAKEYAPAVTTPVAQFETVREELALQAVVDEARAAKHMALHLLTSARTPMSAELVGLALSLGAGQAYYVPLAPSVLDGDATLRRDDTLRILKPLLEDPDVKKSSFNSKHESVTLARHGVSLRGLRTDLLLAAYLLNPGRRAHTLSDLAADILGEDRAGDLDVVKAEAASLESCARAAATAAELVGRLVEPVRVRLEEQGVADIYETLELPLTALLGRIEQAGVKVDVPLLRGMSRDMERQLEQLTREIYVLAGGEFNIQSPIQLREVLFDKLGLKAGKKTAKTRASSTAEEVLEELAFHHDLPRRILDYRSVHKLKSTYVDALPELVHPQTGRIHALLNQTVAATGRLSTSDPNLQNIPIRTAEGRRIREAFVAEPGHLLLSADYSQIELRVLAHLSKDETLIDTFRRGEDVHERTAREVFGAFSSVPVDEQRRVSKMVNYALLYGKTSFTLAKDLGVPRAEAETFIQAYFARYPKVRGFIEDTVAQARESGVVRTLLGRLRRLPDLRAKNFQVRAEAERQAMNTPVQGSAADLIKKAMLDLQAALDARGMQTRQILQIHDELLLEVPESEAADARALVRTVMESAMTLDVPLVVDARLGRNWAEAH